MIHLLMALEVEARPVVAAFGLHRATRPGGFRTYTGDDLRLVITGVGRRAAAAAVGTLRSVEQRPARQGWINYGIGGHQSLDIGRPVLAERIVERATGDRWSLGTASAAICPTATVCTVDQVEEVYAEPWVYEMEASGFYSELRATAATPTAEPIEVLKVVSDNRASSVAGLDAARVERLAAEGLPVLEALIVDVRRRLR